MAKEEITADKKQQDSRDGNKRGGRGGKRGPQQRSKNYEEDVIRINRSDKVVKGGKNSSFSAFVVLGDGKGKVGYGMAKAKQVPAGIEKAVKVAEGNIHTFSVVKGTLPHEVEGKYLSTKVRLIPAADGTGVIAGKSVASVMNRLGVHNVLTKVYGSRNPINVVRATFDALSKAHTKEYYQEIRGVKL